ncbi:helix-turn-helix domain-containing protein [Alteraurantiacibacter buctensis]|uniref:Helix-turn-helix domain-containing protein n=1 Tax=Alteraurantiacibacter buctensis TaxID=1503981 RepID=A0A844Z3D3_9SPHN|nr:helix-turn-helix domain-containing protein [Alteraurantiacibacter buctensis]MXO72383.1 helix-turn-helix domain-containing protein [Alteraurantiacibacter buctensis]
MQKFIDVGGNIQPLAMRPKEAWEMLKIGKTKGWELVARGDLEAFKIDGATRITTASIHALVQRQLMQAAA